MAKFSIKKLNKNALALVCVATLSLQPVFGMKNDEEDTIFIDNKALTKKTDKLQLKEGLDFVYTPPVNPHFENLYETIPDENITGCFKNSCRIDLHNLSENKAKETVISVIQQLQTMGKEQPSSIHFISGRGKHTNKKGNRGTLFKNLPTWLKDKKIAHLIMKFHKTVGAYEVFLKPCESETSKSTTIKVLKIDVIRCLAELGEAQAQYFLGEMYTKGDRVIKDDKLAVQLFRKSAVQGFKDAQFKLGYMCAMGMGTLYSPQEALKWYGKAGKQGCSTSLRNIGTMYYAGEGIPQNFKKAIEYYLQAASLNDLKAMNLLGISYRKIGNDREAVKWDRKAAEGGEPHAKVNLGLMLLDGRGVEQNEIEGIKWLRAAAEDGIVDACMWLGQAYEKGSGAVQQDHIEALQWFLKAGSTDAGKPSFDAQWRLWHLYTNGKGIEHDEITANKWLIRAAENGHSISQLELGRHYRFGTSGFKKDGAQALKYYQLSAKKGNSSAMYEMGEILEMGWQNLKQDTKKGEYWIRQAANKGHTFALLRYGIVKDEKLREFINQFSNQN
jgi:TPR repeat protein